MSYRIGLIGGGFLTQRSLLPALATVAGLFTVRAVLDPSPAALAAVRSRFPGVPATDDAERFFASGLDAVHIATPNASHCPLAVRALDEGLAVIVDKPLADTVAAGERIAAAARDSGAVAMVGYMSKYNAHNRTVASLIRAGAIGEPRSMSAVHFGYQAGSWRTRRAESGLGCLGDLAIYPVLTASDVFGTSPHTCRGTAYPAADADLTDLHAEGTVEFADGASLHLEASFVTQIPGGPGLSRYTVIGSEGVIVARDSWAMNGGGQVLLCNAAERGMVSSDEVDPYVEQYRQLAACLRGAPVPGHVNVERGLHDLAVLTSLASSASEGGRPVPFTPVACQT